MAGIGFLSVRPSALLRLQFWLDPFHIYTSYQATSEVVSHVKLLGNFQNLNFWHLFFKFVTLTLSCFDLGSDVNH